MLEEIHTMLEIYQELIDKTSLLKDKTMPKVELDIIYLTLLDNNKLPQFYNNLKLDIIHIELELLDKIIHTTSLLYIHNARDITPVYRVVHHIRDITRETHLKLVIIHVTLLKLLLYNSRVLEIEHHTTLFDKVHNAWTNDKPLLKLLYNI